MACPKKYCTQQEHRAANSASAQRYRDRNREDLKAWRWEKAYLAQVQRCFVFGMFYCIELQLKPIIRTAKLMEENVRQQRRERVKLEKEARNQERLRAKEVEEHLQIIAHEALRDAEVVFEDYNKYVGDCWQYVDSLYRDYIKPSLGNAPRLPEFFTQSIRPLEIMDKELQQLIDRVYQKCGVVNEWSRIKEIQYEVWQTVLPVDDMECLAMLGLSELIRAYDRKELDFMRGLL
ncbi:hypothetical protein PM082_017804 [Marasmius tenuissimus]|nr:hypothetical protein PM082_017804 [Marasmius tenuissimus]